MQPRPSTLAAAGCVLLFCAIGFVFLHSTGAQYDEVLFASALYPPVAIECMLNAKVPLMLMTYIGALKAWIWAPVLAVFGPSLETLRIPALLIAAASVWLFFLTLRRWTGAPVAVLATLLLATDINYLLTSLYDWGPVALQHLLFTLALYAAVRGWWPLLGFAAGLALFDKAVSIWLLAGLGLALAIVYPRTVLRFARTPRLLAPVVLAFLTGAAPLIYFNIQQPLKTFTANVGFTTADYAGKTRLLDWALRGDGLFGYLTREEPPPPLPATLTFSERVTLRLGIILGNPRSSFQIVLIALSLISLPLLLFGPNGRLALWVVLGVFFTCLLMFSTANAGGALHHTILIWPLPHLLAGLAFGEFHRRAPRALGAIAIVFVFAAASNLAVANTMRFEFLARGPTTGWSDALPKLLAVLDASPSRPVYAVEWGIAEQIRFFSRGQRRLAAAPLADTNTILVDHGEAQRLIPADAANLDRLAASQGLRRRNLATISDRHGRTIYDVFELTRIPE